MYCIICFQLFWGKIVLNKVSIYHWWFYMSFDCRFTDNINWLMYSAFDRSNIRTVMFEAIATKIFTVVFTN